eukprot:6195463-Pleurochrysis_carterae.AAC.1
MCGDLGVYGLTEYHAIVHGECSQKSIKYGVDPAQQSQAKCRDSVANKVIRCHRECARGRKEKKVDALMVRTAFAVLAPNMDAPPLHFMSAEF